MSETNLPGGYLANGWHAGIKANGLLDFAVIYSEQPANAAAVFTRNQFAGNPILVGKEHIRSGRIQAIVVNSGNSNVATGPAGLQLARSTCSWLAASLGIHEALVLPSSTGVIGRLMNAQVLEKACKESKSKLNNHEGFNNFAKAIMTTDRYEKTTRATMNSSIRFYAAAKGAGMIEPDMATMLCFFITDAQMDTASLQLLLNDAVNQSFNRISVDSDTSTSDTVVLLANGKSKIKISYPPENPESVEFSNAVKQQMLYLAKQIVRDGEGASRIFGVKILNAKSSDQARKFGRSVINSPLVKTAVHGADPNWGRLIMAIGKVFDEPIDISKVRIYAGELPLYPEQADLKKLEIIMRNEEIIFTVDLQQPEHFNDCFWGCSLTEDYVRLNAEYTT